MTAPEKERGDDHHSSADGGAHPSAEQEEPRVYLRTTWALNPGLPHAVDFPELLQ